MAWDETAWDGWSEAGGVGGVMPHLLWQEGGRKLHRLQLCSDDVLAAYELHCWHTKLILREEVEAVKLIPLTVSWQGCVYFMDMVMGMSRARAWV